MEQNILSRAAVKEVLRAYKAQYRKYPFYTLFAFLLPAVGTILIFFIPPLLVAEIVNAITRTNEASLHSLWPLLGLFAGVWFLGEICWRIGFYALIRLEANGMTNLSTDTFRALMTRDYAFYANNFTGSLTKKAMTFPRTFERFTDILCFSIIGNLVSLIFAFAILWRYAGILPLILIIALAIVVVVALPLIKKRSKIVALRHDAGSKVSGTLSDVIGNAVTVKAFATEEAEQKNFEKDVSLFVHYFKKAGDWHNMRIDMVIMPLYVFTNLLGLIAAIYITETQGLEVGVVVLIFSYYNQITRVFWEMNRIYRDIESSISEAGEFTELMLTPPRITDQENPRTEPIIDTTITFKDVHFSYITPSDDETDTSTFLHNFNLTIRDKEKVGLVGPSGSGKTTITKLLLRFADVDGGSISIGDTDIRHRAQHTLHQSVGYVSQEPMLFHRTLFENIAYGKPAATAEDVERAAKLAHAHEFITELPHGYETLVGERGVKLSGGQRQRIAIARAILKNAPILVLDEATSALDSESEKYIQEGLWELMKDKTALVIAHRLSTIKHLDRIIVLDGGKIVQEGTHAALIKKKGLYATLWSHQSGGMVE